MLLLLFLLCMIKPYLGEHPLTSNAKKGCEEKCGNVTITYPFGIGPNCSIHDGFAITCNHTHSPPKPFLKNTNLEVLEIDFNGRLKINNPVISSGCSSIVDSGPPANLSEIPLSPFSYNTDYNRFVSTSCNHISKLYVDGNVVAGCTSICSASSSGGCDGINCCQATIQDQQTNSFTYINASVEKIKEYDDENTCKMMFIADQNWVYGNWVNNMGNITHVPADLLWKIYYDGNKRLFKNSYGASCYDYIDGYYGNQTTCDCKYGYVGNPYIGCEGFRLLYVNYPIISSGCSNIVDNGPPTDLFEIPLSPFSYSANFNRFVSISCNHFSKLSDIEDVVAVCGSICSASSSGKCDGINCCQTTIPDSLTYINASMEKINGYDDKNTCKMMFVADKIWVDDKWLNNNMGNITHVQAILDWYNYEGNITSQFEDNCRDGYEGNPYLGCEDIDECGDPSLNQCAHYCRNYQGGYECYCKAGYIKLKSSFAKLQGNGACLNNSEIAAAEVRKSELIASKENQDRRLASNYKIRDQLQKQLHRILSEKTKKDGR